MRHKSLLISLLFLSFISTKIEAISVDELSLEEKVGQLFITYFEGDRINGDVRRLIDEMHIGGILYYPSTNSLDDPFAIKKLSENLQHLSRIPLFIALDQEGGVISPLKGFPGNAAIGKTGQPKFAYQIANQMGKDLLTLGINLNFAPVVDVDSHPDNPIIGARAYSQNPKEVVQFGSQALRGFLDAGLIPCCKHFPGHGDTDLDSHTSLPLVNKDLSSIEKTELYPFHQLMRETPMIMSGHLLYPALDPDDCASLSKIILTDLLRDQWGYQGVIITDSLTMIGATYRSNHRSESVIRAFEAGNDLLLIGSRQPDDPVSQEGQHVQECLEIYQAMIEAVKSGRISEARVNQSVQRVISLKEKIFPFETLKQEIAYRSVFPKKLCSDRLSRRAAVVCPDVLVEAIRSTDLPKTLFSFDLTNPHLPHAIDAYDTIIFCSYRARKFPKQFGLIRDLSKQKKVICISTCEDDNLEQLPNIEGYFVTYSPNKEAIQVASDWIQGTFSSLNISQNQIEALGRKIWQNECNGKKELLTSWNPSEPFPSMGIGHFIWPPKEYRGSFTDGEFEKMIKFLQKRGLIVPAWINRPNAPWKDREEFLALYDSKEMIELRELLEQTWLDQAHYIVHKLYESFTEIVHKTPLDERAHLINQFFRVAFSPNGLYVLIDYLNFKGSGTNPKQRYEGEGWGLMHVLQNMSHEGSPTEAFIASAKRVLLNRTVHAPNAELEKKWLPGWFNRLETYKAL